MLWCRREGDDLLVCRRGGDDVLVCRRESDDLLGDAAGPPSPVTIGECVSH
ncbi:hypothetical protein [Micromonospora pattaloongensis]|uniref:hypothetical protein n=1 Tax=Micromonospora pattaloongensis TaxID=405436 RepID=UPI0015871E50|nr:hypothetical protein [Micromonospora pattaloongensis]